MIKSDPECPIILKSFKRHTIFQDLFRYYLNQEIDKKVTIPIVSVKPEEAINTESLSSEEVELIHARLVVKHDKYPTKEQFHKHLSEVLKNQTIFLSTTANLFFPINSYFLRK
jgi:hypothetical protein